MSVLSKIAFVPTICKLHTLSDQVRFEHVSSRLHQINGMIIQLQKMHDSAVAINFSAADEEMLHVLESIKKWQSLIYLLKAIAENPTHEALEVFALEIAAIESHRVFYIHSKN